MKAHIASHYKEFGETPPWEKKSAKAEEVGDPCELEDGTPGTLADDPKNPGRLVCVPSKSKSESMNTELEKKFKAEHERHGMAFAKAIDEFKSIDEFTKSVDQEQGDHLENTMKAIDEGYALEDQAPKKSIDEFKAEMKAEHLNHVKAIDKSIEEFKSAHESADDDGKTKAIEEFTKAVGEELDRHEKAHKAMCEAEFREGEGEEKSFIGYADKLEAPLFGAADAITIKKAEFVDIVAKAGRAISAKNRDAIEKVIKACRRSPHGARQTF